MHYYQPNHINVPVSVKLQGGQLAGSFQANYCPSISGCRAIVKFQQDATNSTSETFTNQYFDQATFQLLENGRDIWLESVTLAPAIEVTADLNKQDPIDMTSEFIRRCASNHFNVEYYKDLFCDQSVVSLSAAYNDGAKACDCDPSGSKLTRYNP